MGERDRYPPTTPFRRRSAAGQAAVNRPTGVRVPAPELAVIAHRVERRFRTAEVRGPRPRGGSKPVRPRWRGACPVSRNRRVRLPGQAPWWGCERRAGPAATGPRANAREGPNPSPTAWRHARLARLTGLNPAIGSRDPVGVRSSLPPLALDVSPQHRVAPGVTAACGVLSPVDPGSSPGEPASPPWPTGSDGRFLPSSKGVRFPPAVLCAGSPTGRGRRSKPAGMGVRVPLSARVR